MVRENEIKRAVSEYVAAKAGTNSSMQSEAMRRLIDVSAGYLNGGGSDNEWSDIVQGRSKNGRA